MYHGYYRRYRTAVLYTWLRQSQCIPRAAIGRGFPQISVNFLHASCALRALARWVVSKIKIRTSSRHKANELYLLWRGEVRILIFDDPTEQERWQRPEFRSTQLVSSN